MWYSGCPKEEEKKACQEGPWVHPACECTSCACCFPEEKVTAKVIICSVAEAAMFQYLKPPSVIVMCCPSCVWSCTMSSAEPFAAGWWGIPPWRPWKDGVSLSRFVPAGAEQTPPFNFSYFTHGEKKHKSPFCVLEQQGAVMPGLHGRSFSSPAFNSFSETLNLSHVLHFKVQVWEGLSNMLLGSCLAGIWWFHLHLLCHGNGLKDGGPGDFWQEVLPWRYLEPPGFLHCHGWVGWLFLVLFVLCLLEACTELENTPKSSQRLVETTNVFPWTYQAGLSHSYTDGRWKYILIKLMVLLSICHDVTEWEASTLVLFQCICRSGIRHAGASGLWKKQ